LRWVKEFILKNRPEAEWMKTGVRGIAWEFIPRYNYTI